MKNRPLLFAGATAIVTLALALPSCTSVLGDFEVLPASTTGADSGQPPPACTTCDGVCVDTTNSAAHCGACGKACAQGQTCEASECKCPADGILCEGRCAKADRAHCGASCAACQADELCDPKGCVPAAQPAFESAPLDTTGWVDAAGNPIRFKLKATDVPGTIYECRTGPADTFTPTVPAWKPCDDGNGTQPTHTPQPFAAAPEGTYRTEHRYRSDTFRSATIAHTYYVHRSLDKVPTCPRAGQAADGPKFTDDQYFQAAQSFSAANAALFPTSGTFPTPGLLKTDPMVIQNPFIKVPFTNVIRSEGMLSSSSPWPATGDNYLLNERALRHKYALNASRTMILVKRRYVHPKTGDCKQTFLIGGKNTAKRFGPTEAARGSHKVDCEAYVLNTRGQALCIGRNSAGTAPAPIKIDTRPVIGPDSLYGYAQGAITVTVNNGNTTAALPGGSVASNYLSYFVQIPGATSAADKGGFWYKVVGANLDKLTISPSYSGGNLTNAKMRAFPVSALVDVFDIPTGYAKLHDDAHTYATGAKLPGTPDPRTKCETPGCNTGKPWLTYLPP